MKKSLYGVFLAAVFAVGTASAQSGIAGGSDGLHQYSAQTLGQWNFEFGTGGNASIDAWSLSKGGAIYNDEGKNIGLYDIDGSFTGNFNFAVGLLNWLDFGFNMPVYYEYVGTSTGEDDDYNMSALSRGDLETWVKARFVGDDKSFFSAAVLVQGFWPTGEAGAGIRPRHAWYVSDKTTSPYSADAIALAASGIFTLDFSKKGVPVRWNTQLGFLHVFDDHKTDVLLYSTGLNWMPHRIVDVFLEFSGEMRVSDDVFDVSPIDDPMIITPGFRFHVTRNVDFGIGLEIAARVFKNIGYDYDKEMEGAEDMTVHYINERNREATYGYASTPLFAGAATLIYRFGAMDEDNTRRLSDSLSQAKLDSILAARAAREDSLRTHDSDHDGIVDMNDHCPNTRDSVLVDSTGCPLDGDQDGVPDGLDKCPTTPKGVTVDKTGCEPDFDKDGITDVNDMCPNTPEGVAVDQFGCAIDSDKDGVADSQDKCPNTPAGVTVDNTGCPQDFDKDGVFDINDKCPNTPAGVTVDEKGCSLDGDKDGVADGIDKCPNTPAGVTVDENGCSLDFDRDGVTDIKDKCPNTLMGIKVDENGCPLNKKEDLDALKKGIGFKLNSATLTKNSYGTLNDIAKLMKKTPNANLEVQGHTDETGTDEGNNKLSEKRAQAVVKYLVKKGVKASRLRAKGYGSSMPKADNSTESGRSENRRVELVPFYD